MAFGVLTNELCGGNNEKISEVVAGTDALYVALQPVLGIENEDPNFFLKEFLTPIQYTWYLEDLEKNRDLPLPILDKVYKRNKINRAENPLNDRDRILPRVLSLLRSLNLQIATRTDDEEPILPYTLSQQIETGQDKARSVPHPCLASAVEGFNDVQLLQYRKEDQRLQSKSWISLCDLFNDHLLFDKKLQSFECVALALKLSQNYNGIYTTQFLQKVFYNILLYTNYDTKTSQSRHRIYKEFTETYLDYTVDAFAEVLDTFTDPTDKLAGYMLLLQKAKLNPA